MSAWIVSHTHIDLLITAGITLPEQSIRNSKLRWEVGEERHELDPRTADDIGGMLWAENYASVNERYPDTDDLPGPVDFEGPEVLLYSFEPVPGTMDPAVVLKAIRCYEYQSCEHPGWENSSARAFCESLRRACIEALPGYQSAPWDFDERDYFVTRPTVYHYLDVSTGHLTDQEMNAITAQRPHVIEHEHGAWVLVQRDYDDDQDARDRSGVPHLHAVLELARRVEPPVRWINFDADGDELHGLPMFDW